MAGVSPRRPLDDDYRGFLDLLAGQIATAVANARAYEEERRRAEALAELDRAKTAFFSNVSHEFRTPLTLMLGPVEDVLARGHGRACRPPPGASSEVVHRNGLRLLRLVNTLLDFSRIEAGRVRAVYQPTDLAAFTADLASVFRSACRAGRAATWRWTARRWPSRSSWTGRCGRRSSSTSSPTPSSSPSRARSPLRLRTGRPGRRTAGAGHRDGHPGRGDAPAVRAVPPGRERAGPHPRGERDRAGAGAGTGQAARRLHHRREQGWGRARPSPSRFPLGSAHLPPDQIGKSRTVASTGTGASPFVEEALALAARRRSRTDRRPLRAAGLPTSLSPIPLPPPQDDQDDAGRVCWWPTTTPTCASTSRGCWPSITASRPSPTVRRRWRRRESVAGPDPDRRDDAAAGRLRPAAGARGPTPHRALPVILLSARAGEESRVEGMEAGADDYLVKPFSARELLARVGAHLQINRLRQESERAIRQSEERFRVLFETMSEGFAIDEILLR